MRKKLTHSSAGVAHHVADRTRLRIPQEHRHKLKEVSAHIKNVPGVNNVYINERTGSIIVHHDHDTSILERLGGAIQSVAGDLFDVLVAFEEQELPGYSVLAHVIKRRFAQANSSVANATENTVDLKMLLPLAFFGWGLKQASSNPGWWAEIPAWALFYYAYDSYIKFFGPSLWLRPVSTETSASENIVTAATTNSASSARGKTPISSGKKTNQVEIRSEAQ